MSIQKIELLNDGNVDFLAEQIGNTENEFKRAVVAILRDHEMPSRAYLAQIIYGDASDFNVALCLALKNGDNDELINKIALAFSRMFGSHEHLDILFLSESQEMRLRRICCPFFSSRRFSCPDFYLSSSEGYGLEAVRACYKERRLMNSHPDGYMLCEIDPPILGQLYGLGEQNLSKVIIAGRHAGHSIFAVKNWPTYVHVARFSDISVDKFIISENDIDSIGWAEIYESAISSKAALN